MKQVENIIARARSAPPEERTGILAELDDRGIFMAPDETWENFVERVCRFLQALREFRDGTRLESLPGNIDFGKKIPDGVTADANNVLKKEYNFTLSLIPGFYSRRETGRLAAGVLLEADEILPLIFLHDGFSGKKNFRGYDRSEVLAHELTHGARMFFPDSCYEEYFTCRLYNSPFRQLAGNFFRSRYLVLAFGAGFFAEAVSLDSGILWGALFFLLPLLIFLNEARLLLKLKKAKEKLLQLHLDPLPVLVRLSDREIFLLSHLSPDECRELEKNSLRWQMFFKKFHI